MDLILVCSWTEPMTSPAITPIMQPPQKRSPHWQRTPRANLLSRIRVQSRGSFRAGLDALRGHLSLRFVARRARRCRAFLVGAGETNTLRSDTHGMVPRSLPSGEKTGFPARRRQRVQASLCVDCRPSPPLFANTLSVSHAAIRLNIERHDGLGHSSHRGSFRRTELYRRWGS